MKNKTHLIVFAVHRTSSLGVFPGSAVDDPRLKSTTVTYSSVPATRRATSKITEHMHELPDGCSLCGITRMYGCQSRPFIDVSVSSDPGPAHASNVSSPRRPCTTLVGRTWSFFTFSLQLTTSASTIPVLLASSKKTPSTSVHPLRYANGSTNARG